MIMLSAKENPASVFTSACIYEMARFVWRATKMRVYISGPITGIKDFEERFLKAESEIREKYGNDGIEVINPCKVNYLMPVNTSWQQYMDVTLQCLRGCDLIYMLHGWQNSKGAQIEKLYAEGSGMRVVYEP